MGMRGCAGWLPDGTHPGRNLHPSVPAHEPSPVNAKLSRYVFWPLWFVVVPLALCMLVVWLVKPAQDFTPVTLLRTLPMGSEATSRCPRTFLFFTVFEMVLYSYRHSLPFVGGPGGNARNDVPKNHA